MKRRILSLVTLVAMMSGIAAFAQSSQNVDAPKCNAKNCADLFDGITLTPDQQKQIDQLTAEMQSKCVKDKDDKAKCDKSSCKKNGKDAKATKDKKGKKGAKCDKGSKNCDKPTCSNPDSAKCNLRSDRASRMESRKAELGQRKACKQEFISKVKGILTPEQYVKFLENMAVNGGPRR